MVKQMRISDFAVLLLALFVSLSGFFFLSIVSTRLISSRLSDHVHIHTLFLLKILCLLQTLPPFSLFTYIYIYT